MNQMMTHKKPRLAIIGGGISGMSAAYELADQFDIYIFEAEDRLGGHARTVLAGKGGQQPVDTGFIVFNYVNYPHFTKMIRDLGVEVERSDMSFGVSVAGGEFEFALKNLRTIFGQKRNFLRPQMYRMIRDILRFGQHAEAIVEEREMTIGALMAELNLGKWFQQYYLLPISGAIWSTPPEKVMGFSARALVNFFRNHGLLEAGKQHQWWPVTGGSINYVKKLEANIRKRGVGVSLCTKIASIKRDQDGVTIVDQNGSTQNFDAIIMACHSDTSLALLDDATDQERAILSAIEYQDNEMILHCDERQMPIRRNLWSSWVYQSNGNFDEPAIGVTYWMNRLQNIPIDDPLFVTLNPLTQIDPNKIYDQKTFRHPVFSQEALEAQQNLDTIQGQSRTYFAGAWTRNGFHEDGFASAVRVARLLQKQLEKAY